MDAEVVSGEQCGKKIGIRMVDVVVAVLGNLIINKETGEKCM